MKLSTYHHDVSNSPGNVQSIALKKESLLYNNDNNLEYSNIQKKKQQSLMQATFDYPQSMDYTSMLYNNKLSTESRG